MSEKNKVRMARNDDDSDFQGHTIVGGRPAGNQELGKGIPRGMELLIKKASVDEGFAQNLLTLRAKAADELGIPLDSSERTMLDAIPAPQLSAIIRQTRVPAQHKAVLLGTSAAAMLALMAQFTFSPVAGRAETPDSSTVIAQQSTPDDYYGREGGARPDMPAGEPKGGVRPDYPMPPGGARPDVPEPVIQQNSPELEQTVKSDQFGKLFLEAVENLKKETGIRIDVEVPSGMNISWSIADHTADLTLRNAIGKLTQDAKDKGFQVDILQNQTGITIRFRNQESSPPPPEEFAPTRGVRPDYPAQSKGHRADFPENSQKKQPPQNQMFNTGGIRPDDE